VETVRNSRCRRRIRDGGEPFSADAIHSGKGLENFSRRASVWVFMVDHFGGVERSRTYQNGFSGMPTLPMSWQQAREADFLNFGLVSCAAPARIITEYAETFCEWPPGYSGLSASMASAKRCNSVHHGGRNGIAGVAVAMFDQRTRELFRGAGRIFVRNASGPVENWRLSVTPR